MKPTQPLARPPADLKPRYTAVVIGSGYGAGVAASRLARAGQSVCVLERGREIRPGDYPADLAGAQAEMQIDTSRGRLGTPDGLFNLHVNADMLALVGCGLGGTSLINANVALEIDKRLFAQEHWPAEFRNDPDLLDADYAQARRMLDPSAYPQHFPPLNKLQALEQSAKAMKQPFSRPPIAVNFRDQVNPFGVGQKQCALCGDCTTGCNHAAKNTTLMNYLPDAVNHGAEIFTQLRVTHLEREGSGWRVHIERNAPGASGEALSVAAEIVMLGAGSLGSTEILLRSKARGLPLSERLGQRFSGNGDVLAFGYDNHWRSAPGADGQPAPLNINGIGAGTNELPAAALPGPCITGLIDMRDDPDPTRGLVIEEGVIPGALASLMPAALFFANTQFGNFFQYGADQAKARLLDAQAAGEAFQNDPGSMAAQSYSGPAGRTQTYLVMSVDEAGGTLALRDDRLRIDWPGAGSSAAIERDNRQIQAANEAIQGQFIPNPLWTEPLGKKLVTVHPVGGCGMGDSAESGVVNPKCQVFSGAAGSAVHEGLYVCDGAVMPGPVGVNPLLTISAVAERACRLLVQERGWTADATMAASQPLPASFRVGPGATETDVPESIAGELEGLWKGVVQHVEAGAIDIAKKLIGKIIDEDPKSLSPSFQFTETMHGHVSLRALDDTSALDERITSAFQTATAWGRAEGHTMRFELTIRSEDLDQLTTDPTHPAAITGSVTCPALSARPMAVSQGAFHLLPIDTHRVETWLMTYDMLLTRDEGGPLHFNGFKVLHQREGSHWWDDVTTLYVMLREGGVEGPAVAKGMLTLDLEDLMWQGSSIQLDLPPHGGLERVLARVPRAARAIEEVYLAKFGGFFGMTLFRAYGGLLATLKNFPLDDDTRRPRRALLAPPPQVIEVPLPDRFAIRLTRYAGGSRGPVMLAPGFSVKASSFAIDTVDQNLVEYLTAQDYDVWLFDYRASPDSGSPLAPYTIDDIARIDWPAAVRRVREETGAKDVQVLAHCVGSMSLLMALLDGLQGVRSVIASQLTLHPVTNWLSYLKTDLNLVSVLEGLSQLDGAFDIVGESGDLDHEIDALTWNVPVPEGEQCQNPVCRRIFSIFGPSYTHGQLNHWTHTAMCEMFGQIALKPFEQLTAIMAAGIAVDADGHDSYMTAAKVGRLALPISFVAGDKNRLFFPETARRTDAWLRAHNEPSLYERRLFTGYAHMDLFIGRDAAKEVYPYFLAQLERFNPPRV